MTPPQVGSGKVTDSQVAFMVECYLRDSHFSRTLQEFRLEAARLLHPLRSVPKGARSLSAVLNDYVALKEEQISAAAEKARVEDLFHGLQDILSVYLSGVPKNAGPMGEARNEALSPPPFASPAGAQQPQIHVLHESEEAALPGRAAASTMDHHAKEKVSSHKRKIQGKSSGEPLQHGDSCVDLVKKPRRGSTAKQSSSDLSPAGNLTMVDSNVCTMGTDCLAASKTVQPATPPMATISCKQQQQALPCGAMSESPQPSPSPTEAAQSLVSPKNTSSTPTAPPSTTGDTLQHHQDPQTPPPSTKSSLNANKSTFASSREKETCSAAVAPGKPGNVLQRRKAPVQNLPSVTSHYSLRAHKKPSAASCIPLSDAQSNCAPKPTRKRAINSKCRLLDFSAAMANAGPQVDATLKQSNNASSISASSCISQSSPDSDSQHIVESSAASDCCKHVPDFASSSEILPPQEFEGTVFSSTCDAFSFDELFDLDLDTSLISELEDLAAITGCDTDPSSCMRSSETAALPCPSEPSSGGVLIEIDNFIHSDEAAAFTPRNACPSAGSFKQRKSATIAGNENSMDDKENTHALVVSH